jgi:hypothetical protein
MANIIAVGGLWRPPWWRNATAPRYALSGISKFKDEGSRESTLVWSTSMNKENHAVKSWNHAKERRLIRLVPNFLINLYKEITQIKRASGMNSSRSYRQAGQSPIKASQKKAHKRNCLHKPFAVDNPKLLFTKTQIRQIWKWMTEMIRVYWSLILVLCQ